MRIDPTKTWRAVAARLARERDPSACYLFEARMAVVWPIGFAGIAARTLSPDDLA
jgi:hypothetical protein